MKSNIFIIACVLILNFYSTSVHAETIQKTKAEYVMSLIVSSSTTKIIIYANNFDKAYSNVWLANVVIKDGFLVFSKGNSIHSWYIENAVFIEKEDNTITIHLNETIH